MSRLISRSHVSLNADDLLVRRGICTDLEQFLNVLDLLVHGGVAISRDNEDAVDILFEPLVPVWHEGFTVASALVTKALGIFTLSTQESWVNQLRVIDAQLDRTGQPCGWSI